MSNLERAQKIIELDGADGYYSAATLVGPNKADKLLADLIRKNMRSEGYKPKAGEVKGIVAATRKRKGF
jgi:hypothetical protein